MAQVPVTPAACSSAMDNPPLPAHSCTPASVASNNTYLMAGSPTKRSKNVNDSYKPKVITTVGQKPACLVNASLTYVGSEQIYAFGGFDQFTDEGGQFRHLRRAVCSLLGSLQSCTPARFKYTAVEPGRQFRRHTGRSHGYFRAGSRHSQSS